MENCRTEALGGHVYQCDTCGELVYSYHSCRNRHCNQCQTDKAAEWLAQQHARLLPVPYFLVTFTLPKAVRAVAYTNQQVVYNLLFRCAAEALQELAADPRFVGGQVGAIGVLHTWKRDLGYHPHVHFLVPGGGVDFVNDRWLPTHNHFFVRVEPLSMLFRAKMRDGLKKAGLYYQIPAAVWRQAWVVHSKSVGHGETAAAYLVDYLFRVGISNSRIVKLENDEVTFWYINRQTRRHTYVTLPVFTFIQRFLHHVLPQGFVKVRYYGFFAPAGAHWARQRLVLAKELLAADQARLRSVAEAASIDQSAASVSGLEQCPHCGGKLRCIAHLRPRARCPP